MSIMQQRLGRKTFSSKFSYTLRSGGEPNRAGRAYEGSIRATECHVNTSCDILALRGELGIVWLLPAKTATNVSASVAASKVSLKERKLELVRDTIWTAAIDLFAAKGFEETTIDDIVDAV